MVYVVVAIDQTGYRLVKVFSTSALAEACKSKLKELLWRTITITVCSIDDF
jgi:hypothetical protein